MESKKGFEIQFNWIFVLVIGAAILLFFASLVFKQRDLSEAASKTNLLRSFQDLIEAASVSIDTSSLTSIPKSNIKVECSRISAGGTSRQYQNLILFAPSSIKGSKLVSQTSAFNIPYRSSNILYITSQEMRYIFIGNNELYKEINRTLPAELSKENYSSYDPSKIKDTNNYKVRLIFVNSNLPANAPQSLEKMPNSDVTAIKISGDKEKGTVDFYQKNGNAWSPKKSSVYIGKHSLLASIYTDTEELYSCNMRNVFSRAKLVTEVYKERANKIVNDASTRPACKQVYINALPKLKTIYDSLKSLESSTAFDIGDAGKVVSASRDLVTQNKEAQKFSCPLIY